MGVFADVFEATCYACRFQEGWHGEPENDDAKDQRNITLEIRVGEVHQTDQPQCRNEHRCDPEAVGKSRSGAVELTAISVA